MRDRVFLSSNIQSYENSFRNLLKDGLHCNIYHTWFCVYSEYGFSRICHFLDLVEKKMYFVSGLETDKWKKFNKLKESIFSTVHLPPVHIQRKSLNL